MSKGILAVGLPHSRGVIRVMSSEAKGHSKGVTLIRKDKGNIFCTQRQVKGNVHRGRI
jgi:hypothetical protein